MGILLCKLLSKTVRNAGATLIFLPLLISCSNNTNTQISLLPANIQSNETTQNQNFTINGTKNIALPTLLSSGYANSSTSSYPDDVQNMSDRKIVKIIKITPSAYMVAQNSEAQINALLTNNRELNYSAPGITAFSASPGAIDLTMNNVPVLDQGIYGTCVTFATTVALDARFGLGDYIDQECVLSLNLWLGNNYWDGAYNTAQLLEPLKNYGFIQKGHCYGANYGNRNFSVPYTYYQVLSNTNYSNLIKYSENRTDTSSLDTVKAALNSQQRVLIGFALSDIYNDPVSVQGFNVQVIGGGQGAGGLWACTQPGNSRNYCNSQSAAHEVLIIGYDDAQQLLKIRNSWGSLIADNGDFYMTYAFFRAMVFDYTIIY